MTDDLDSANQPADNYDAKAQEKSKRGRFKDVLDRTRHKITERVREEKEARKWSSHSKEQQDGPFDADVAEFLAAGRINTSSSTHISVFSDTASENGSPNDQTTPPRPSTSDSKSQASPKRVPVPRIDVSASQRFPNAKEIGNSPAGTPRSLATGQGGSLLKPEYKSRSQSASCIASPGRKARIRGLSVGFIDAPPVVIGEGGDEAEAPPVEISRAKTRRAKSASPQGRNLQQQEPNDGKRQVGRGNLEQSGNIFNPKPVSRVPTGTLPNTNIVPNTGYDTFVPKPFRRTQTGALDGANSPVAQRAPPLPQMHKPVVPADLGRSQTVTNHRTRELELSLGLTPTSPTGNLPLKQQEPRIFAPKPQRAPPSYDLIESGPHESHREPQSEPSSQSRIPQDISPQRQHTQQLQQQQSHAPISPAFTSPDDREHVFQQTTPINRYHQNSQQVMHPESHQQMSQQGAKQDYSQQNSTTQDLLTRQENIAAHISSSSMRQQEQAFHHTSASQQSMQDPVPQRPVEQNRHYPQAHQYRLPDQNFGQPLDLTAEQISQPGAQHRNDQVYPEYENYLRSSALQNQESPPRSTLSRFASLHSSTVRNNHSSPRQISLPENEPSKFTEQPLNSDSRPLPPVETSHIEAVHRSPAESSASSSQPVSRIGSSVTASSHHPTLRRVPALQTYQANPSNQSSAVASPESGEESGSNNMRFYESINKGNPPAGYI